MISPRSLLALTAVTAGALALPLAGSASAHVTVQGPGATQGGYTKLTFRMPVERDIATTALEIAFPAEHPITSIRVKPKAGWSYELVRTQLAVPLEVHGTTITESVSRVVWTATGAGVGPNEFEEFEVSAGPLPEVDAMVFPALQTYADGEVVRWIETATEGAAEPALPAPVLTLAAASGDAHGSMASAEPVAELDVSAAAATSAADSGTDPVAAGALGIAVVALAASAGSFVLRRRA